MDPETREVIQVARAAVDALLAECRKARPLYRRHPKAVAQVNRTGKWLLNALAALDRDVRRGDADPAA